MERSSETRTNDGGDGGDDARGGSTRLSFDRGCLNLTRMMSASSARAEVCRVSSGLSEFIGVVTTVDAPIDDGSRSHLRRRFRVDVRDGLDREQRRGRGGDGDRV